MMKSLHSEKGSALRIEILQEPEVIGFVETHAQVLDSSFAQTKMSDTMRRRLEESNYIFSGMKTFHELNEAFPSLVDENGNRKPFEQFLNDVRSIDEKYNENYLRAEYNFVNASADMAAKWEQFEADGDRYNLQYRTAGDDKVRDSHKALNRITLPVTDPFWNEFFPPNGWGCRCTVVQVRKSKYPVTSSNEAIKLGEEAVGSSARIFKFNPGKEKQTFAGYNPYSVKRCNECSLNTNRRLMKFIPDNELCAACKIIRKCVGDKQKSEKAIERTHYLYEMERLLDKKISVNGNGHQMTVGFRKDGNQHLYSDTYGRSKVLQKEDLKNLDTVLANAEFIKKSGLSKPRKDEIKRFYYYKATIRGKTVYLNVAETDFINKKGKIWHNRYLYSITDKLK